MLGRELLRTITLDQRHSGYKREERETGTTPKITSLCEFQHPDETNFKDRMKSDDMDMRFKQKSKTY